MSHLNRTPQTDSPYGTTAILLAALLWGTTGTVASFAPQVSALAIGAFAMGIGGLLQAMICGQNIINRWQEIKQYKALLVPGVASIVLYPLAFYSSMRFAGVAVGTVVTIASAPFAAMLLEYLSGQSVPVGRRWLLSVLLGVSGVVLLSVTESASVGYVPQWMNTLGVGLGLVAGATYAAYSWVAKRLMDKGLPSQPVMGTLFGLGAIVLLPSLAFSGDNLFSSPENTLVALYMALVPMFLGYLAFGYGLRTVPASRATLLTLFEPVVAALLAVFLIGETLTMTGWTGMGLIGGCLLIQAQPADKPSVPSVV